MCARTARKSKTRFARTKTPELVTAAVGQGGILRGGCQPPLSLYSANLSNSDEASGTRTRSSYRSGNRAVLTINRKHFITLHHQMPAHCGIVVCSLDADFAGQANRIHQAVSQHADLTGVLIRVNRPPDDLDRSGAGA